MTPEKLLHELPGLGMNWEVKECEFDRKEGVVRLRIEESEDLAQEPGKTGRQTECRL
jgi:hypothetical protein